LNPNPDKDPTSASQSQSEESGPKRPHILIVEDNRADLFLIRESIETVRLDAELHFARDGEKAIRFFEEADRNPSAPCPALIILDINLPKKSGREVLYQMRKSPRCANCLVLVVTSSDSERDRDDMRSLGAKAYFRKPSEFEHFMKLGEIVKALLEDSPAPSSPAE
jgi:two-component system, chemotaxis family, response regulator Rcp1